jgi:PHD/YefM family antitoxin component YafN of YafNO toxin-antitoxin module
MPATAVLTIKQLHDETGLLVRRAGASRHPVAVTDRGREVAVITNRAQLRPKVRKRTILPEYAAIMAEAPADEVQAALDEDRGTR